VARLLPTLLVLALIGSTAVAFAVTEGLKLEKSPIGETQVSKEIAPTCGGCAYHQAAIDFFLRKGDRLTVAIVNSSGEVVRTLAARRRARRGTHQFIWDGLDDARRVPPDGTYRPQVHLAREHRTIVLPNPIRLDTKAPQIRFLSARPPVFSPDGDFQREYVRLRYATSEQARAILYVDGDRRGMVRRFVRAGKLDWGGKALRRLPAGPYRLQLRALDVAGNLSRPTRTLVVRIRYVQVLPHVVRVRSGHRFRVRVLTDAVGYIWHLGSRGKAGHAHRLVIRAGPPGRYVLRVAVNRHVARALVLVRPRS
jgi:FlgD Ig-like domain